MKVRDLIEKLKSFDPDTEVMTKKTELFGNVGEVNCVRGDSYGFFGKSISCVLLTDEFEDSEDN